MSGNTLFSTNKSIDKCSTDDIIIGSERPFLYNPDDIIIRELLSYASIKETSISARLSSIISQDLFETQRKTRFVWHKKAHSLMTLIGSVVGISRFSFIMNGGIVYMVIYILVLLFLAFPLLVCQMTVTQFSSRGITQCWRFAAGFKAIGYALLLNNLLLSTFYNLFAGWAIYYAASSLYPVMPWTICSNFWNNDKCYTYDQGLNPFNLTSMDSSCEQFWFRHVVNNVQESKDENDPELLSFPADPKNIIWFMALALIMAWVVCSVLMMNGPSSINQAMHVLAIYPVFVIVFLIIVASQLEGSNLGISNYFKVDFSMFIDTDKWFYVCCQVLFSLNIGSGGLMTFAGYNDFHMDIQKKISCIIGVNLLFNFFVGLFSYEIFGFLAYRYNIEIEHLRTYDFVTNLFINFPQCLSTVYGSNFISFVYFTMIFSLTITFQMTTVETVITSISDEFPVLQKRRNRHIYVCLYNLTCNLIGLGFVTRNGNLWVNIMLESTHKMAMLTLVFVQSFVFAYVYGFQEIASDYWVMCDKTLGPFLKFLMTITTPVVTLLLCVRNVFYFTYEKVGYSLKETKVTNWIYGMCFGLYLLCLMPIPVYFVAFVLLHRTRRKVNVKSAAIAALKPHKNWGPQQQEHWCLDYRYLLKYQQYKSDPDFLFHLFKRTV